MVQPSADTQVQHRYDLSSDRPPMRVRDPAGGWLEFSVVLLGIAGTLNIIGGIGAISDSKFYVQDAQYVIGSLHTWGWVATILGVIQILVAMGIWRGNQLARWVGVLSLALNSIGQLLALDARPFWSLAIFALDMVAIYGLIAYGRRPLAAA
jgi:hypothetical protein